MVSTNFNIYSDSFDALVEIIKFLLYEYLNFIVIISVFFLFFYLLQSVALMRLAKRFGLEDKTRLAWVPVMHIFIIPMLVEEDVHDFLKGKFTSVFAVLFVLSFFITPIFLFVAVLYGVYFIMEKFSENATLHILIAAFSMGVMIPVQLFLFSFREGS